MDASIPLPYASSVEILFPYLNQDKCECFQEDILLRNKVKENKYKDRDLSLLCPESYPNIIEVLLPIGLTGKTYWAQCSCFSGHIWPCFGWMLEQDAQTSSLADEILCSF